MKKIIYAITILFNSMLYSQTFDGNLGLKSLNWTMEQKDFNSPPRVGITPMSIKLWDNYESSNAPSQWGSLLEINGRGDHLVSQLYFVGNWDNDRILYRNAFYGQSVWKEWRYILDSKNDIESTGNLKITGNANSYILNGNVGIGNVNPLAKLDISGNLVLRNYDNIKGKGNTITFTAYGNDLPGPQIRSYLTFAEGINSRMGLVLSSYSKGYMDELFLIDGNVGIGKTNPTNKLDVNGTIHSKEVKVDTEGWSDFVFKKEYNLPTLADVEKHINEKGHLENIPSEEEVLKNGINLGEMNTKLLQKIEELTLYSIQQSKEIETLKEENKSFKKLSERLSLIEQKIK